MLDSKYFGFCQTCVFLSQLFNLQWLSSHGSLKTARDTMYTSGRGYIPIKLVDKNRQSVYSWIRIPENVNAFVSHWRRKWQPTSVLLPGESHGWRSLVGYGPRGCKESDMTERLHFHFVSHSTFLTIDSNSHFCVTALAAAAAKSLQSCPTLWPHRRQPTRLPCSWDSPGKNTGVGCRFLLQCRKVKSESEVAQSCPTLSDAMDYSPPGSSIHGIFQAKVLEWVATACSG